MTATILEFLIVLAAILLGARQGGLAIGYWGGLGLVLLAVIFGVTPTAPPVDVMLIIIAVCMSAACMDAAGSFVYMFWGKELKDDPEYQRRLKAGLVEPPKAISDAPLPKGAKLSVAIFLLGVLLIVLTGFFPELRAINGKAVSMSLVIEMAMLAGAAMMAAFCHANLDADSKSLTLRAGVVSVGAIFGIAWLADSFIGANKGFFMELAGDLAAQAPWLFAFVLFFMSALLTSQGATTRAIMPLGLTLGIPVPLMIAMFPAVNGLFFLPIMGPALSAVSFDRSGTTKIGKYILNHSFQIPGIVMVVVSVLVAMLLTKLGL